MEFVEQSAIRANLAVASYDRWIIVGYAAFAVLALVTVYFAAGGPGVSESQLAIATVFP